MLRSERPIDVEQLNMFMHTLFLEEYRLSPREANLLTNSIGEFQQLAAEEVELLADMHLSFLKRSEMFSAWQALME